MRGSGLAGGLLSWGASRAALGQIGPRTLRATGNVICGGLQHNRLVHSRALSGACVEVSIEVD